MRCFKIFKKKIKSLLCGDEETRQYLCADTSDEPKNKIVVTVDEHELQIKTECPDYQLNLRIGETYYTCEKKIVKYVYDTWQEKNHSSTGQHPRYDKSQNCNSSDCCVSQENSGYYSQETSKEYSKNTSSDELSCHPGDSMPSENAECPELGLPSLLHGKQNDECLNHIDERCGQGNGQMQSLRKGSLTEESDDEHDNETGLRRNEGIVTCTGHTVWVSHDHVLTRSSSTPSGLDIYSTQGTEEKPTHELFQNIHSLEAESGISRREISYPSLDIHSSNMPTADLCCTPSTEFCCQFNILSLKSCSSLQLHCERTFPKSLSVRSFSVCSVSSGHSYLNFPHLQSFHIGSDLSFPDEERKLEEPQLSELVSDINTSEWSNDEKNGEDMEQLDCTSTQTESLIVGHPLTDESSPSIAVSGYSSLAYRFDEHNEVLFNIDNGVVEEDIIQPEIKEGNFENLTLQEDILVSTNSSQEMNREKNEFIRDGCDEDARSIGQLSCQRLQNFDVVTSHLEGDNGMQKKMEQIWTFLDTLYEYYIKMCFPSQVIQEELFPKSLKSVRSFSVCSVSSGHCNIDNGVVEEDIIQPEIKEGNFENRTLQEEILDSTNSSQVMNNEENEFIRDGCDEDAGSIGQLSCQPLRNFDVVTSHLEGDNGMHKKMEQILNSLYRPYEYYMKMCFTSQVIQEDLFPKSLSVRSFSVCSVSSGHSFHIGSDLRFLDEERKLQPEIKEGNFENLTLQEEILVSTNSSQEMNREEHEFIRAGCDKGARSIGQLSYQPLRNFDVVTSHRDGDNKMHKKMEQILNSLYRPYEYNMKMCFIGQVMQEELVLSEHGVANTTTRQSTPNDIAVARGKWDEKECRQDEIFGFFTFVSELTSHCQQNFAVLMDTSLRHGIIPCLTYPTMKTKLCKGGETITFAVHSQQWPNFDLRDTIWIHFLNHMLSECSTVSELQFLLKRLCPWLLPRLLSGYSMHLCWKTMTSFSSTLLKKLYVGSCNICSENLRIEYNLQSVQDSKCLINTYPKDDDSVNDSREDNGVRTDVIPLLTRESGILDYPSRRTENFILEVFSNVLREIRTSSEKTMETIHMYLLKNHSYEAKKNFRTTQQQLPRLENQRTVRCPKAQRKVQSDKWKKGGKKVLQETPRANHRYMRNCCKETRTPDKTSGKKNSVPNSRYCNGNQNENYPGSVNTIMDDFNNVNSPERLNRRISVSSNPSSMRGLIVKLERLGNKRSTQNRLQYWHEFSAKEMDRIRKHIVGFFQRFEATKHRHSLSPVSMEKIDNLSLPEMLYKIQSIPKGMSFLRRYLKISKDLQLVSIDVVPYRQPSNWPNIPRETALDNFFEQVADGDDADEARMRLEWFRVITFQTYPANVGVSTVKLANNGFYYTGHTTETRCYFCRQTYDQWNEGSNIEAVHRQISPDCPLINGRETNNIPVHGPRNVPMVREGNLQRSATEHLRGADVGDPTPAANTMTLQQGPDRQLPQSPQPTEASAGPTSGEQTSGPDRQLPQPSEASAGPTSGEQTSGPDRQLPQPPQPTEASAGSTSGEQTSQPASIQTPSKSKIKRDKRKKKKEEQAKAASITPGQETSDQGPGGLVIHEVPGSQEEPASLSQSEQVSTSSGSSQDPTSSPGLLVREVQPHSRPLGVNHGVVEPSTLVPVPQTTRSNESLQTSSAQTTARTTPSTQSSSSRHGGANPPAPSQGRANPPGPTSAERLAQLDPLGINFDKPKYPSYAVYSNRHGSFEGWPSHMVQTPREMSRAGFYYAGYGDYARCFFCGGGLRNWDRSDDPWIEHARWFPRCAFLRNNKGDKYVARVQRRHQEQEAGLEPSSQLPPPQERDMDTSIAQALREMGYHNQIIQRAMNDWRGNLIPGRRHPPPMTAASILDIIEKIQSTDQVQTVQAERPLTIPGMQKSHAVDGSTQSSLQPSVLDAGSTESPEPSVSDLSDSASALEENRTESATVVGQPRDHGYTQRETQEKKILQEDFLGLTETLVCKVCCDKDVAAAFLPCGHLVCCLDCAPAMRKCPLCDELIKGTVKTYFS